MLSSRTQLAIACFQAARFPSDEALSGFQVLAGLYIDFQGQKIGAASKRVDFAIV